MLSSEILKDLIAFPTVSRSSNLQLLSYVEDLLAPCGAAIRRVTTESDRANLWITIGPADVPGVLLSGHSDVVPVSGQPWSHDPFTLVEEEGLLYGRGTADMKGFLACALACAIKASQRRLATPLHIAISYDEEIGCVGVRSLLGMLENEPVRPALCWIGEPTSMRLATGHKGKVALRALCTGRAAHSALAPNGLNAIHLATDFIASLRELQNDIAERMNQDPDYDIPYSTVHVGLIAGGEALNIVPSGCTIDFEVRNIAEDSSDAIVDEIRGVAAAIVQPLRTWYPEADIAIEIVNAYPGLNTRHEGAIQFMSSLSGTNDAGTKVPFGTEGGLFSETLGIPAVLCGPGSMDQGHKANEFVAREQIELCDAMLDRLLDRLEHGLEF
ncbi:acetylornithine deacetylase (ArgE) [Sphingobium chlorophenolicum L-1]|uniref:Acetylornithine deacetylase (ArgE) n=1 Tax=Sphingobium chlorophenolicum L-1 TaxID=690566 RepID=F6ETP5_SPHCR|nr:acetylornithine deacetylase [Sphingobium chlorophenolicum]AEG49540.1 acetylornithine deacetylase (ArgE) [Sphingobium chlorophenolicum L-1]